MPTGNNVSFLDLPPELRNKIYDLSLISEQPINPIKDQRQPALTRTCRQIRNETLPLYYATNTFELTSLCFNCNYCGGCCGDGRPCKSKLQPRPADWIKAIGYRNLRHLTRLHLQNSYSLDVTLLQNLKAKTLTATPDSN